jgi:DNA-binding MarR family transcriptional regulator
MRTMRDERTPPLALADDLGLMLSRLGTVTRLRLAEALSPLDLTMRQFAVLRALASDEGLSQAALGERLQIDASSIVLVLDECQKAGWAERRPNPTDRRRYAIHLTPAGRRVLIRAQDAAEKAQAKLFAPLDGGQKDQLRQLLLLLVGTGQVVSSPAGQTSAEKAVSR